MRMRGGGSHSLDLGINQTVDFIFYNGNTVLVHPNPNVATAEKGNLSLVGTFAKIKNNENPLTLDEAKDRALNKFTTLKINITKDDLSAMREVEEGKFYDIHGDKRSKEKARNSEEMCTPFTCPIKTQVFSMDVDDRDKNKFMFTGAEWVDIKNRKIFKGHSIILNKLSYKNTLPGYVNEVLSGEEPAVTYPEREPDAFLGDYNMDSNEEEYPVDKERGDVMMGGRRTRKRRGKKSKKAKKKGKKTKKRSKKTQRRRH